MAKKTDTAEAATATAELPPDTVTEREPPAVKLAPAKGPDGKPEDRPPVPPVAYRTPAPRSVHQNLRAPDGLRRYKVVCRGYDNFAGFPTRYVLAADEEQARAHYLRVVGLAGIVARLARSRGVEPGEVEQPQLAVTALPD